MSCSVHVFFCVYVRVKSGLLLHLTCWTVSQEVANKRLHTKNLIFLMHYIINSEATLLVIHVQPTPLAFLLVFTTNQLIKIGHIRHYLTVMSSVWVPASGPLLHVIHLKRDSVNLNIYLLVRSAGVVLDHSEVSFPVRCSTSIFQRLWQGQQTEH